MKHTYRIAFWSPFPVSSDSFCPVYFQVMLRKYEHIICYDYSSDTDPRMLHTLRQMDLILVGLPQNLEQLDRFFTHMALPGSNLHFLLLDYMQGMKPDYSEICHRYRISDRQLDCIPYNVRYQDACGRGQAALYLLQQGMLQAYEMQIGFFEKLNRTIWNILKSLEHVSA